MQAEAARDAYKRSAIADIEERIAVTEEILAAKTAADSAEKALAAYHNKALLEYGQVYSELATKIDDLRMAIQSAQSKSELLLQAEKAFEESKTQLRLKTIVQIDNSTQALQAELSTASANLEVSLVTKKLYDDDRLEDGAFISASSAMIEKTMALMSQRDTIEAKGNELDIQQQQLREQIAQGTVTAPQGGIINAMHKLVPGDLISSGTAVATIISSQESEYKVYLYVNNADIGEIEAGDAVRYNIAAFPSDRYGYSYGSISKISQDALVQDGQYSGYYLVECTISSRSISDKEGNTGSISSGMQVEAKIVTQEKTIIYYLLEKIDIF